jgi:arylsulfatase
LSPRLDAVPAWDTLTANEQDRYDQIMAIYAAVVHHMDRAVGVLIAGLKERGELENTLILFMSDNGGNAEAGVAGRMNGMHPGDAKSDVFVGQCWATLNNTPFVRYKHFTDEGGISTPLIVHWPKGVAGTLSGRIEKQPGHVIDIMATCIDVAGATYPQQFNGKSITPLEGVSLRPAFDGKQIERKQPLFGSMKEIAQFATANGSSLHFPTSRGAFTISKPIALNNTTSPAHSQSGPQRSQPNGMNMRRAQMFCRLAGGARRQPIKSRS